MSNLLNKVIKMKIQKVSSNPIKKNNLTNLKKKELKKKNKCLQILQFSHHQINFQIKKKRTYK